MIQQLAQQLGTPELELQSWFRSFIEELKATVEIAVSEQSIDPLIAPAKYENEEDEPTYSDEEYEVDDDQYDSDFEA